MLKLNRDILPLEASLAAVFTTAQRLPKKLHLGHTIPHWTYWRLFHMHSRGAATALILIYPSDNAVERGEHSSTFTQRVAVHSNRLPRTVVTAPRVLEELEQHSQTHGLIFGAILCRAKDPCEPLSAQDIL